MLVITYQPASVSTQNHFIRIQKLSNMKCVKHKREKKTSNNFFVSRINKDNKQCLNFKIYGISISTWKLTFELAGTWKSKIKCQRKNYTIVLKTECSEKLSALALISNREIRVYSRRSNKLIPHSTDMCIEKERIY